MDMKIIRLIVSQVRHHQLRRSLAACLLPVYYEYQYLLGERKCSITFLPRFLGASLFPPTSAVGGAVIGAATNVFFLR